MSDTIKDAKGRTIEVRELTGREMSRMARLAGNAWGANEWTSQTVARASVVSINDIPPPPRLMTIDDLDALWDAVDNTAMIAAAQWIMARQESAMADAKNSSAPQASESVTGS